MYKNYENSEQDYSDIPELESCPSMGSVPDLGEDSLSPELHFQSRTPITDGHSCTGRVSRYVDDLHVEVQEEGDTKTGGCCTENAGNRDEHDVQCHRVDNTAYPNQWNLGFTQIQFGMPSLRRIE